MRSSIAASPSPSVIPPNSLPLASVNSMASTIPSTIIFAKLASEPISQSFSTGTSSTSSVTALSSLLIAGLFAVTISKSIWTPSVSASSSTLAAQYSIAFFSTSSASIAATTRSWLNPKYSVPAIAVLGAGGNSSPAARLRSIS